MPRRTVQAGLVVVAVVVALVVVNRGDGSAPPAAAPEWTTWAAEVTGVRPGADPASVLIDVSIPDCGGEPRVEMLTEENDTVYANVVVSGPGTCTGQKTAEVVLRTPGPLGTRPLMLNTMDVWGLSGGAYARCDEQLGCVPPADHCAEAWIDKTVYGMDVPIKRLHGVRDVRGCDGDWLVLDLNRSAGDCPPAEGAPPCTAGGQTSRVFFEWRDGWTSFAGSQQAGCADAHAVRPQFPAALCAALGAP
ncbi:hypothetical protein [Amycolatopsis sp. 195334CR]|uniref:hypothetical protein n=1 Tax=Amycolatopsis sp. 195334CR TaxID=2814588 RepID=UPI001A8F3CEA|nr:hypothetical protein [Amycolatopsis sp. 195334CR]MBN6039174.1 hypothetical protein [Amycolatopsis sp. 195334CR]